MPVPRSCNMGEDDMKLLLAILAFLFSATVEAEIFKCKDTNGKTSYSSTQCKQYQKGGEITINDNSGWSYSARTTASKSIKNRCYSKWGTDYEMVEYCIKNQNKAVRNLSNY